MSNVFKLAILFFMVFLHGCATQEFRNALNSCRVEAMSSYPVVTANVKVTEYMQISGKKGSISYIPYESIQQVDINEVDREAYANKCAQYKCLDSYGNADCQK